MTSSSLWVRRFVGNAFWILVSRECKVKVVEEFPCKIQLSSITGRQFTVNNIYGHWLWSEFHLHRKGFSFGAIHNVYYFLEILRTSQPVSCDLLNIGEGHAKKTSKDEDIKAEWGEGACIASIAKGEVRKWGQVFFWQRLYCYHPKPGGTSYYYWNSSNKWSLLRSL